MRISFVALLALCACDAPEARIPPEVITELTIGARHPQPLPRVTCTTTDECEPDEICAGAVGDCDAPWTCQKAPPACTFDMEEYCTCDGVTIMAPSSCVGVKVAYEGACWAWGK